MISFQILNDIILFSSELLKKFIKIRPFRIFHTHRSKYFPEKSGRVRMDSFFTLLPAPVISGPIRSPGSPDRPFHSKVKVKVQEPVFTQFAPIRHFPVIDGRNGNPGILRAEIRAYCIVFSRIRYFSGPGEKGPGKSRLYGPRLSIRACFDMSILTPLYPFLQRRYRRATGHQTWRSRRIARGSPP
jgi:hypothetical protein